MMDYRAFVTTNASAFLQSRRMAFEGLAALARDQGFEAAQVLLTSSPVHGIATATSDVDLICITPAPVSKGQMATQIHRDGQHCELLPFFAGDLEQAFDDLASLAQRPLPERLTGYLQWDAGHAVRRKYLERIVYGVDTAGGAPCLAHLPALVPVVAALDYDSFHQSRVCAWLAYRAGEAGAAHGYLLNACLAGMATALSLGGWILSNKKWTLRRWREAALPAMRVVDAPVHAPLTQLWQSLAGPPAADAATQARLLARLDSVAGQLASRLGADAAVDGCPSQVAHESVAALDKRSAYLIGADGRARLAAVAPPGQALEVPRDVPALAGLQPLVAAALLRSARSGMLDFSLAAPALAHAEEPLHATA